MDIRRYLTPAAVEAYEILLAEEKVQMSGNCEIIEREEQGYVFSFGLDPEVSKYSFEKWQGMKEDTVYVMNFPKTGNHWTFEIVRCLLYLHDEEQMQIAKAFPNLMNYIDFPDRMCCEPQKKFDVIDQLPLKRHAFCGHLPEPLFDFKKVREKKGKVICVIRNPKDQAVSWYHFAHSEIFKKIGYPKDWSVFLEDYLAGKHHLWTKRGEWYLDHLLAWWKHKDDDNILFLQFENMKKDLRSEVRKIAEFIGVNATDEMIDEVIERTSIKSMRNRGDIGKTFARKGEVAGWKNWFTIAQSEMMDKIVEEKISGTGIEFIYNI